MIPGAPRVVLGRAAGSGSTPVKAAEHLPVDSGLSSCPACDNRIADLAFYVDRGGRIDGHLVPAAGALHEQKGALRSRDGDALFLRDQIISRRRSPSFGA